MKQSTSSLSTDQVFKDSSLDAAVCSRGAQIGATLDPQQELIAVLVSALEVAINTVECDSLDKDGNELPWHAGARKALALAGAVKDGRSDADQPCPDPRCNDTLGAMPIPQCVTAVAWAELVDALTSVLREMSDRFNSVDNGHCTLCPSFRLYDTRSKVQPCENKDCLSYRIAAVLDGKPSTRR